jgi:hypothetical protein
MFFERANVLTGKIIFSLLFLENGQFEKISTQKSTQKSSTSKNSLSINDTMITRFLYVLKK